MLEIWLRNAILGILWGFFAFFSSPSWALTLSQNQLQQVSEASTSHSVGAESDTKNPSSNAPWQATHIVRPGDTLWELARLYQGNPVLWREFARSQVNSLPKKLQPGTILLMGNEAMSRYAGRVVALTGDVRISNVHANGTGIILNDIPLKLGMPVPLGAQLRTGPDSFVTLVLSDGLALSTDLPSPTHLLNNEKPQVGSLVTLRSLSHVKVISVRDTKGKASVVLELYAGQINSHALKSSLPDKPSPTVPQPYSQQIRTRSATIGVKGTYFSVCIPLGTDTVATSVLDGTVEAQRLGFDDAVLIEKSQGAIIGPNGIVRQNLLPAPQWVEGKEDDQNDFSVNLNWHSVPDARIYRLQLAKDAGFLDIVSQIDVVPVSAGNSAEILHANVEKLPIGNYFAKVSAFTGEKLEGQFAVKPYQRKAPVSNLPKKVPAETEIFFKP